MSHHDCHRKRETEREIGGWGGRKREREMERGGKKETEMEGEAERERQRESEMGGISMNPSVYDTGLIWEQELI